FNRGNDPAAPAHVSPFRLDRYEITMGRYRRFIRSGAGVDANPPHEGDGLHPLIPESGWKAALWRTYLPDSVDLHYSLSSCSTLTPFSREDGADDNLPMPCLTWYSAFAFCAWDGGR